MKFLKKYGIDALLYLFLASCIAFVGTRAHAMPAEEAHGLCYGYAEVTFEAAKARDRGVTHEEALEVVKQEDTIYTEIVNFVFDNPTALATELAAEVYKSCMGQVVTEE